MVLTCVAGSRRVIRRSLMLWHLRVRALTLTCHHFSLRDESRLKEHDGLHLGVLRGRLCDVLLNERSFQMLSNRHLLLRA